VGLGSPRAAGLCLPPRARRTFLLPSCYQGGKFWQPHLRPRGSEPPQFLGFSLPRTNELLLEGRCDETSYHVTSHAFSDALAQRGMYRNDGLNTSLEKSRVTGPANFITPYTLDFHPSYKVGGPSHC
uniref:Uncharacterized protein n=1 Tax=Meleagris gallopavo TaxID=9103 RepID=A0A803XRN3_MELGA